MKNIVQGEEVMERGEKRKKLSSNNNNNNNVQILPEDIIVQILSLLAVKTLVRLKSVCKLWESLISYPKFSLSSHQGRERAIFFSSLTKPSDNGKIERVLQSVDHNLSFYELPNPVGEIDLHLDYKFFFLGSCNGLLLFCAAASTACSSSAASASLYVWNPSTRESRELTELNGLISNSPIPFDGFNLLSGLCFDQTSDDYKIVVINQNSEVHVASLRYGMGLFFGFPYEIPRTGRVPRSGFLFKGHLHWIVKEQMSSNYLIIHFDETTNRFVELPMPMPEVLALQQQNQDRNYYYSYGLGDLDGFLYLIISSRSPSEAFGPPLQVFIMKEYGVQESWTKVKFSKDLPGWLPPVRSTRLGGHLLFRQNDRLIAHNLKDKWQTAGKYMDDGPIKYVETLASVYY